MKYDFSERLYMLTTGDDTTVYLKNVVDDPFITVGEHTYYNDQHKDPRDFVKNNVLYKLSEFYGHHIYIGKYCSLASGLTFIGPLACHKTKVASTYPFGLAHEYWDLDPAKFLTASALTEAETKGPTVIGNDVWTGYNTLIMPGVKIGDGAVVGSRSIVTKDVEPYTIVAGAPARPIRKRFDDETIESLLELKWWDLPEGMVAELIPTLVGETDMKKVIEAITIKRMVYEVLTRIKNL